MLACRAFISLVRVLASIKVIYKLNRRDNQTQFDGNRATCAGTICKSSYRDYAVLNALIHAPQSSAKMALVLS